MFATETDYATICQVKNTHKYTVLSWAKEIRGRKQASFVLTLSNNLSPSKMASGQKWSKQQRRTHWPFSWTMVFNDWRVLVLASAHSHQLKYFTGSNENKGFPHDKRSLVAVCKVWYHLARLNGPEQRNKIPPVFSAVLPIAPSTSQHLWVC